MLWLKRKRKRLIDDSYSGPGLNGKVKNNDTEKSPIWEIIPGRGCLLTAAIHSGHEVSPEVKEYLALPESERLREEDPFTDEWTMIVGPRILGKHSRFEVDLNRPRNKAIYRLPEDAWGMRVWRTPPPDEVLDRSLEAYDAFYREMNEFLSGKGKECDHFVVLDIHSYNHRREGPNAPPADPAENPEVNVGTGTLVDHQYWQPLIERFMADLHRFDYNGRHLDVRENVRFRGGFLPQWIHEHFPSSGCCLAIEFKKFFMDEWTGEPDHHQVELIREALNSTLPGLRASLGELGGWERAA